MARIRVVALSVLLCIFASACASAGSPDDRLTVVASFYPLAEIAQAVGGDAVTVTNLTPAGGEAHDLELRPSDTVRLRRADLVLYLGDFQPAVQEAAEGNERAIDLLERLSGLIPGDEHVWLDPVQMMEITGIVREELTQLRPDSAPTFQANADGFRDELRALDEGFSEALARAKCMRRELFTTHAAFGYLVRRYNLEQIAITGVSPEAEPSPQRLRQVVEEARAKNATTIFAESEDDQRAARTVARAIGARVAVLNPVEGLTAAELRAGEDYFSVMRTNLRTLQEALGCR